VLQYPNPKNFTDLLSLINRFDWLLGEIKWIQPTPSVLLRNDPITDPDNPAIACFGSTHHINSLGFGYLVHPKNWYSLVIPMHLPLRGRITARLLDIVEVTIKLLVRGRHHCDDADEYRLSRALLINLAAVFCTELRLAMPTPGASSRCRAVD